MNKVYLIFLVILLAVIFFFPKTNNVWSDSFTASVAKEYKNMDCTCLGFVLMQPGLSQSDTQIVLCYGLPINCEYTCSKEINSTWQNISCSELS